MNLLQNIINDILPQGENTTKKTFQPFEIENITIIRPYLLKIYYWEYLNIKGFNEKLLGSEDRIVHDFYLPTSQLNSRPLKIVYWIKNLSQQKLTLTLKRVQNCSCQRVQTKVGFNQFRYLYQCPHRYLIHIMQEFISMNPDDLVAMTVIAYFYLFGEYVLSYEMRTSDSRVIILNFHVNIVIFDPSRSVLTEELIPIHIKDFRRLAQPIWVTNITMQSIQMLFKGRERGFRLINPRLTVPPLSTFPLIIEYRPNDFENNVELALNFSGARFKVPLTCKGYLEEIPEEPGPPIYDYDCTDFLYVVYPNKLVFTSEVNEEHFLMVAVHNYNQQCMDFKWQPYSISGYFDFYFEPSEFNLKPHHSRLCMVCLKTYDKPLHFKRIPAILEVHRILNRKTVIAKQLLTDVESIDDPKYLQETYMEYVYIQLNIKVNYPKASQVNLPIADEGRDSLKSTQSMPFTIPSLKSLSSIGQRRGFSEPTTTIFEKLFWDYLSKTNYIRNTSKVPINLTYEEVISGALSKPKKPPEEGAFQVDKGCIYNIICHVLADACRDLARNYRFVPPEYLDPI